MVQESVRMARSFADIEKIAGKIRDEKLRKLVLDTLKNPRMSNKSFKYEAMGFDIAPASINWHHTKKGGLLEHTCTVAELCIAVIDRMKKDYGTEIDSDSLIAAALVHDIGKLWEMRIDKDGDFDGTGVSLDHSMLGVGELFARGFPEPVLHIVASHFGENGPTPPKTVEAKIFHTIDHMDAVLNGEVSETSILQLLLG